MTKMSDKNPSKRLGGAIYLRFLPLIIFISIKNKWEDATNITFSKWNSQDNGGGVDYDSARTFMPSWLETLVYGDRYTLYAQWTIKP